jgi:hypothetical protein
MKSYFWRIHMHRIIACLLFLAATVPAAAAKFDAEARARTVAPFLDEQTVVVIHGDLSRVNAEALMEEVARIAPISPGEVQPAKAQAAQMLATLTKAGAREFFFLVSLSDLPHPLFLIALVGPDADLKTLTQIVNLLPFVPPGVREKMGDLFFAGNQDIQERLKKLKASAPRPDLARAFAAAGDTDLQVIVLVPPHARRAVEELLPTLPREVGGGPSTPLVRGVQFAALGINLPPAPSLRLVIQSPSADAAQALHEGLTALLTNLGRNKEVRANVPFFDQIAGLFKPKVEDDRLTLSLEGAQLMPVLRELAVKARAQTQRTTSMNNDKQILLALHNYHDVHKTFPAVANFDKNGKPLLSWRVHILPYLDQEKLFRQFHLDEPWDSAHNKKLIAQMPKVFRNPESKASPGKTTYLGPVGNAMMFTGEPKGVPIAEITDGTANTVFIVEVDDNHAATWTRPEDWKVDLTHPEIGLRCSENLYHFGFADGSVRFLHQKTDPKILKAFFTRNGGEVIPP